MDLPKRELRYFVAKYADIQQALSDTQLDQLMALGEIIDQYRSIQGKLPLECVVVESDWPEYQPVWNSILSRSYDSKDIMFYDHVNSNYQISTSTTLNQYRTHETDVHKNRE